MIKRVRTSLPEATIVVSVITDSGVETAQRTLTPVVDGITYAPIDLPGATRRAARVLRPDVLVLEYAELWPNLLSAARSVGARTMLANGRLHPRRMSAYRWMKWLFGSPLIYLDRLLMRSAEDAERARLLGAKSVAVEVTGNSKFDDLDRSTSPDDPVLTILGPGPWLVAGSTHREDESAVLEAFAAVRVVDPEARLLLVPRHSARATAVAAAARRWRWRVAVSALDRAERDADVVVVDAVGRLRTAYAAAKMAIVGGGFGHRGGHNVLEPAAVGVPVVSGPDLANFVDAVELLRGRGLIQVPDVRTLVRVTVDLWSNDGLRSTLGAKAREAVAEACGAADRNVEAIIELASDQTDTRRTSAGRSGPALLGPGPADSGS